MRLDEEGNGTQRGAGDTIYVHRAADRTTGLIGRREITVADAERLIELRQGYAHRDINDLALLEHVREDVRRERVASRRERYTGFLRGRAVGIRARRQDCTRGITI